MEKVYNTYMFFENIIIRKKKCTASIKIIKKGTLKKKKNYTNSGGTPSPPPNSSTDYSSKMRWLLQIYYILHILHIGLQQDVCAIQIKINAKNTCTQKKKKIS